MHQQRRRFLIQAGTALATACGGRAPSSSSGTRPCATPADGPGLGYCLVGSQGLRVVGAARLSAGQVMVALFDDSTGAIVARDEGGFYALSATCTHACCNVNVCGDPSCASAVVNAAACETPLPQQLARSGAAFLCPCHGSEFASDGRVLNGPAHLPLPSVPLAIQGDDIIVDLSRAVSPGSRTLA